MQDKKTIIIGSVAAVLIILILLITFLPDKKEKVEPVETEEVVEEEIVEVKELSGVNNYLNKIDRYEVTTMRDFVKVTRISDKLNNQVIMPILRVEYKDNTFDLQVGYDLWYSMPEVGIVVADMDIIKHNQLEYIVGIHPSPDYEELLKK